MQRRLSILGPAAIAWLLLLGIFGRNSMRITRWPSHITTPRSPAQTSNITSALATSHRTVVCTVTLPTDRRVLPRAAIGEGAERRRIAQNEGDLGWVAVQPGGGQRPAGWWARPCSGLGGDVVVGGRGAGCGHSGGDGGGLEALDDQPDAQRELPDTAFVALPVISSCAGQDTGSTLPPARSGTASPGDRQRAHDLGKGITTSGQRKHHEFRACRATIQR